MSIIIFTLCVVFCNVFGSAQRVEATGYVPLENIKILLLYDHRNATRAYLPAAPQLNCLGGSAGCRNTPSIIQCSLIKNATDDLEWNCVAKLTTFTIIKIENVTCEYNQTHIQPKSCSVNFKVDNLLKRSHIIAFSAFCATMVSLVLILMCSKMILFYCKNITKVKFRNNFKRIRKHPNDVDLALLDGISKA